VAPRHGENGRRQAVISRPTWSVYLTAAVSSWGLPQNSQSPRAGRSTSRLTVTAAELLAATDLAMESPVGWLAVHRRCRSAVARKRRTRVHLFWAARALCPVLEGCRKLPEPRVCWAALAVREPTGSVARRFTGAFFWRRRGEPSDTRAWRKLSPRCENPRGKSTNSTCGTHEHLQIIWKVGDATDDQQRGRGQVHAAKTDEHARAIRGTEAMGSTAYHLHSVHMLHSRQLLLDYY
jgi:hypothetical protein